MSDVRRLALARFLSLTGNDAVFLVGLLGSAVYQFDADAAGVAPLILVIEGSFLAGSAVGGPLVDRFDPRRVLLAGELLAAPVALSLTLPDTLGGLLIGTAGMGLLYGIVRTASASFAPFLTTPASGLGVVNASLELAEAASAIAGAALAALLAATAGIASVFVLDAVTSILAVLLVVGVSLRPVEREEVGFSARELVAGLRLIAGVGVLRFALTLACLSFLAFGFFGVFEALFFRDTLAEGVAVFGIANAVFGVGLVVGALLARRVLAQGATLRLVTLLVLGSGLGAVAYTAVADVRVVYVGALGFGVVIGMLEPAVRTLLQQETPDALVGRVTGVLGVAESSGELLPPLVVGALALSLDPQPVLVGSGLVLAAIAAAALPLAARVEARRRMSDVR